jgi:hypothetical protein
MGDNDLANMASRAEMLKRLADFCIRESLHRMDQLEMLLLEKAKGLGKEAK